MIPTAVTIIKRRDGFYLNHIGGLPRPRVNDKPIRKATILNNGDVIEIGSMRLQFSIETQPYREAQ